MLKDKAYWQVYNQKRKGYLAQKARERRARKSIQPSASIERIQPIKGIQPVNLNRIQPPESIQPPKMTDQLTQLIKQWQTQTNYNCASTCFNSYCSNCWYFRENELIDYKEVGM